MAKLLVIDDDPGSAKSLASALDAEGFEALSVVDGPAALDELERVRVDLVIVDLMLRGMNGIELARQISVRFPSVRVVLTSAYHLSERQLVRSNCGAVGFVPKPYVMDELTGFLRAKLAQA
jgi:DNA-binding response OmpR family regulator